MTIENNLENARCLRCGTDDSIRLRDGVESSYTARYCFACWNAAYLEFILGFAKAARVSFVEAEDTWRSISKPLSARECAGIEMGGKNAGLIQGLRWVKG